MTAFIKCLNQTILLVSDGNAIFGEGHFNQDVPVYSINNTINNKTQYFEKLSKFTGGELLRKLNDKTITDDTIASKVSDQDISHTSTGTSSMSELEIRGKVVSVSGPLQGVTIRIASTLEEYKTKADGNFSLKIPDKTIVTFNYLGMHPKTLSSEDLLETPVIELLPKHNVLGEVELQGQRNRSNDKFYVGTQEIQRDVIGFGTGLLSSEEIKPWHTSIFDVLKNQIPGVDVEGLGRSAKVFVRGVTPKWIIDGVAFEDDSRLQDIIDPQNIESISVIKNSGGALAYGKGPHIFITTKKSSFKTREKKSSVLVQGNIYEEQLRTLNNNINVPSYIKELLPLKSIQERYERYKEMVKIQDPSVTFYIDMAQYFQQYDLSISDCILEELAVLGRSNIKVLRVLAYMYEARGNNKLAKLNYERVAKLAPRESQSYRDLALIYQEIGAYNESLELYINMLGDRVAGVDFSGLEKPLKSELNHLISRYKDKIDFQRLPNEWLRVGYDIDLRMVITWSDPSAPFEFQFVNLDKKYFKWTHTLDQQRERLFQEQDQGFQTEEFIIDDAGSGEWLVNIQYLEKKKTFTIPPYLKSTVYRNYGTPEETKEIKIIKLYQQVDKVTLCKIST